MEAKILFTQPAMIAVPAEIDARMMKELQFKLSAKILLKWLFVLMTVVSITAGIVYWNWQPIESQTSAISQAALPEPENEQAKPIEPEKPAMNQTSPVPPVAAPEIKPEVPEPLPENQDFFPRFATTIPAYTTPHQEINGLLVYPADANHTIQIDTVFSGINHLEVDGMICDLKVKGSTAGQTSIKGRIMMESGNRKKENGDAFKIMVERTGDVLKVWVEQKRKMRWITISNWVKWEGVLEFELPAHTNIKLKSASGRTDVSGMNGNLCDIENSYGPIFADSIHTNLKIKSLSGDVQVQAVTGNLDADVLYGTQTLKQIQGNLNSHSSSGDVNIADIQGNMSIEALYGNIHVVQAVGNLRINSSSGNISIKSIKGDVCNIEASYGNISASQITSKLNLHSKSGNITLHGITGSVKAVSLYGSQHISDIQGDVSANSSSGEVILEDATGYVDIQTLYGNIRMNDCSGNVNLEASSGSIRGYQVMIRDSANIKTGYGDISFDLLNNPDELSYDVLADYGSVRINGKSMAKEDQRSRVYISKGPKLIRSYSQSGNQQFE